MSHPLSRASLISSLLWFVLTLFSVPAGAVNPPGSYGGAAIAGGDLHTLALKSDGTVWAWGDNQWGQLGDGTTNPHLTPVPVNGLNNIIALTGSSQTVALKDDGTVWAWGRNEEGQLGDGTTTNRSTPIQVVGLSSVAAIGASVRHTVALKGDGTVWTWGDNSEGQLGNGTITDRSTPIQVTGLNGVAAISAGGVLGGITGTNVVFNLCHTVALKGDGTVWAWGSNLGGQLGSDTTNDHSTNPVKVRGLTDIVASAAGGLHTVALKGDGTVWAWGRNKEGQLGDGTTTNRTTPVQVVGLSDVIAIAAGVAHNIALKRNGTIWAWGSISGNTNDPNNKTTPFQVSGLTDAVASAAGGPAVLNAVTGHTVALKGDGTVWAWGRNKEGQLGDGTATDRTTPVQVRGPEGVDFLNLFATHPSDSIVLTLEEPAPGSVYSGVSNVRGWAVAPQGLQKIELYVDGALQGNIPLGGRRADVGTAYPSYPGAADSGFAMAFNYSNLAAGSHTLTVRAYDKAGGARDASATFTVARFATSFMADPATVNLDQATLTRSGNTTTIQKLLAAGQPYDVQLTWRPAAQGFALTQINPAGSGGK